MKKLKSLLSLGIALCISVSSITTTFAADTSKSISYKYYQVGDFDNNFFVDVWDVTTLQMQLAGYDVMEEHPLGMSDFNGDGNFDVSDVTETQKMLAGFDYNCFIKKDDSYKNIAFETRDNKISWETKIDYEQIVYTRRYILKNSEGKHTDDYSYLIKSKDEFYSIFGVYSPDFDDEYFADYALYLDIRYDKYSNNEYNATSMAIYKNTLYVDYKFHRRDYDSQPACYHIFYRLNQSDVKNIDTISINIDD